MSRLSGTFTCHVCGDERPDRLIGVARHSVMDANGVKVVQNVRYCTDRAPCVSEAHVSNLTTLALKRVSRELVVMTAQYEAVSKASWWRAVTTGAAVGIAIMIVQMVG